MSSDPLTFDGLALTDSDGRLLVYLMNFSPSDQLVVITPVFRLRRAAIIDDYVMSKWIKAARGSIRCFKRGQ
jgi:hypothetical protein